MTVLWEELATLDGAMERPVAASDWRVPGRVALDETTDRLVWRDDGGRRVRPGRGLLEDFLKLRDAPSARIRDYARRWGPLLICDKHGLPVAAIHLPDYDCKPLGWNREAPAGWEPIGAWRYYARRACAIMSIAARVKAGLPGRADDAAALQEPRPTKPDSRWEVRPPLGAIASSVSAQRAAVAVHMRQWLWAGEIRPALEWQPRRTRFVLGGKGLFGALALQLALAVAGSDGLAVCSACGNAYLPRRRVAPRRRNYCPECGPRVAQRDAARDYRARLRAQRESATRR